MSDLFFLDIHVYALNVFFDPFFRGSPFPRSHLAKDIIFVCFFLRLKLLSAAKNAPSQGAFS